MLGAVSKVDAIVKVSLSLRPRSGEHVPSLTAQVARASNPGSTTAVWGRDRLDGLWRDKDFANWYRATGAPASPRAAGHRLAVVDLQQLGGNATRVGSVGEEHLTTDSQ